MAATTRTAKQQEKKHHIIHHHVEQKFKTVPLSRTRNVRQKLSVEDGILFLCIVDLFVSAGATVSAVRLVGGRCDS